MNNLPLLFVILPMGLGFLYILLLRKKEFVAEVVTPGATLVLFLLSCSLLAIIAATDRSFMTAYTLNLAGREIPLGINIMVDLYSAFMLLVVNTVSFLVAIYSINYMKHYTARTYFYSLFLFMVAGMNGILLTGDLFNLYVFLEIASVSSYILVGFGIMDEELEAAFKYLILGAIASAMILLGVALTYSVTGSLNMAFIGQFVLAEGMNPVLYFTAALFLMGFSLKAALIPFHAWLPDAHPSAPAPISAMLSGVVIKVLGIYALLRIFFNVFNLGEDPVFLNTMLVFGTVSMIIGVLLALFQWDIKRLFAYHSISQMGYVVMAIGLGTPFGVAAGLFHLINHAVFKSLLFLNAGALSVALDTRSLKEMGDLGKKLPVTGVTCMVGSLSISGVPPFNGFWSKLFIILAAVLAGHPVYAFWAVVGSILTLASFMKVQRYAFWGPSHLKDKVKEALDGYTVPAFMKVSMILFAILCIFLSFLALPHFYTLILEPVSENLLSGAAGYIARVGL